MPFPSRGPDPLALPQAGWGTCLPDAWHPVGFVWGLSITYGAQFSWSRRSRCNMMPVSFFTFSTTLLNPDLILALYFQ